MPIKKGQKLPRYDWEYWKTLYVTGDDQVTLANLASRPTGPSLGRLKMRAAEEGWTAAREAYRTQTRAKVLEHSAEKDAQVLERHLKMAKVLQQKGLSKLLEAEDISPGVAREMVSEGIKLERLILDKPTENIRVDDIPVLITKIFEAIRKHVSDPAQIQGIAKDLERIALDFGGGNAQPAFGPTRAN